MDLLIVMVFLVIILVILLLGYASFALWPNRSLWFLLEWDNRQHYHVYLDGIDHQIDRSLIFISEITDLKKASLLRRVSNLPIYWRTDYKIPSFLQRHLLQQANITRIKDLAELPNNQPFILLISAIDFPQVESFHHPLALFHLCGEVKNRSASMRWTPVILKASFRTYDPQKEGAFSNAFQRFSVHAWEHYVEQLPSIVELWLDQAKSLGSRLSVADSTGLKLSHYRLIAIVLGFRLRLFHLLQDDQRVGVCLPASVGGVIILLTLWCLGKTVVPLNYTAGEVALQSAITAVGLKKVITSKRFLDNLTKKGLLKAGLENVELIYVEDIRKKISQKATLRSYLIAKYFPTAFLKSILVNPFGLNQVAVILFSSGSEAAPKGIELTHRNLMGNARQAGEAFEARRSDVMLSILPLFHAFGLTTTTILPLLEGLTLVCHPDPTDTATIGELARQFRATILFSTATFLRLYAIAPNLTPDLFATLRLIVAGAERLSPETRLLFEEKFKKVIFEGYGTTELSPASNVNRPDTPHQIRQKIGSVGRPIPGTMTRIIDPETGEDCPIGEAGLVMIGGVNVMKGYLNDPTKTNAALHYADGIRWYKTGDKGFLDQDGFLTILDRYARFAKIGGEMISLGALEGQINLLLEDDSIEILALAIPDTKKGEKIVLLHTGTLPSDKLKSKVSASDIPNLMCPGRYIKVEAIPKLGSGKTDFARAAKLYQKPLKSILIEASSTAKRGLV